MVAGWNQKVRPVLRKAESKGILVTSAKSSLADYHRKSRLPGRTGRLHEIDRKKLTITHPTAGRVAKEADRKPLGNGPGICLRTDAEIAKAAIEALSWDVFAPPSGIEVIVQDGRLTLLGKVQGIYQRDRIEFAVAHLAGVHTVDNRITIRPALRRAQIEASIYETFDKSVPTDLRNVHVTIDGGKVTLTGRVQSWAEHEEMLRVAWTTAGVTDVETMVTVAEPAAKLRLKSAKDEPV